MATKTIKITDDRQGGTYRTGVNGRIFDLPLNTELTVDEALADHLKGIGCRFDEVEAKRASSSKEGSGEELVRPIGPHDVIAAGTVVKSLGDRPLAGDQPGDVTEGGVRFPAGAADTHGSAILEDAEASNLRVAAERSAPKDASVAEKAGEGEGGTPKAEAQAVEPSHEETKEERKAAKATRKASRNGRRTKAPKPSAAEREAARGVGGEPTTA